MQMRVFTPILLAALIGCGSDDIYGETGSVPTDTADTAVTEITDVPTVDECLAEIGGEACDFTLKDQFGDLVSLSDFEGSPIILDFSAEWCAPCQNAARDLQATQDLYADYGLVYVSVLVENTEYDDATVDDAYTWSVLYGISAPVLAGNHDLMEGYGGSWPIYSWPTFAYINEDFEVEYIHSGYSLATIDNNIGVLLGL
jgi:thiol-disulfide isomerase/thioredoxin